MAHSAARGNTRMGGDVWPRVNQMAEPLQPFARSKSFARKYQSRVHRCRTEAQGQGQAQTSKGSKTRQRTEATERAKSPKSAQRTKAAEGTAPERAAIA